ncbi:beta-propeller fold lactonase family protein [Vibrio porteresiae]|uniref:Beta-propeller fold lactonase family protein n=1 Tax=Vibrio porteresiae DSM 19223 TaxID=1123496 RepID=A0ABZ0QGV3_9VIBR|nr:beta-propeller fold lactonase family protein [Vibrio porteresiae]WPC75670.1 beta-propeller fold lactonase family protein [Vibrio porteresiae DSM 19223]
MKGFPTESSLHAFMLEPRIVFDGDVAVTAAEVADSTTTSQVTSTDATESSSEVNSDTSVTSQAIDAGSTTTSDESSDNSAPEVSTTQDNIVSSGYSSEEIYDDTISEYLTDKVDSVVVSADGNYAYAVSYDHSVVTVFSIAEDGTIELVQNLHSSDLAESLTNGVNGVSRVQLSSDQSHLYVYSETNNSLLTFSRDSSSGELTYSGQTDLSATLNGRTIRDLQENNGYLYASVGSTIYAFQSSDNGVTFTVLDSETNGENGVKGIGGNTTINFSSDGSLLFASSSNGDAEVLSVFSVTDGTMTYLGSVTDLGDKHYIQSVAINEDASVIYLLNVNGATREVLTITKDTSSTTEHSYSLTKSEAVASDVSQLVLSEDGSTLFTFGRSVTAYSLNGDGTLSSNTAMDSSNAKLNGDITNLVHANGKILTVTANAFSIFQYQTAATIYTEGNDPVAILPNGLVSDSELDQLGDYNGATISISRAEAVENSNDSYSLLAGNGLTVDGNNVLLDGVVIGTWSASEAGASVTFTASVSQATAQMVLRQIAYTNTSDDPDAAGANVTMNVTVADGDGAQSTFNVTLNIIDVNDAPILTGSNTQTNYTSGDDYISLFSDVAIDTVEQGQLVWKAIITINGANDSDVLYVDGNVIKLTEFSGALSTVNGLVHQVMDNKDGSKTVVLFLNSDPQAAANTINSISYRTTTLTGEGSVSFNLQVVEQGNTSSETSINSSVTITPQPNENQPPVLTGNNPHLTYTENSGSQVLFNGVTVSDPEMDARNGGQGNYAGTIVSVVKDSTDTEGEITIVSNETYHYQGTLITKGDVVIATVESTDNGLIITFTDAYKTAPNATDVNQVLALIAYTNDANALAQTTDITLTITDSFGQDAPTWVTNVEFINTNDAPSTSLGDLYNQGLLSSITQFNQFENMTDITESVMSQSGNRLFVADNEGHIAVYAMDSSSGQLSYLSTFTRDSAAETLLTNEDGSQLFVVTTKTGEYGSRYSEITVYTSDSQGALTAQQVVAIDINTFSAYEPMRQFILSDNGDYFIFRSSFDLYVYQVDSSTGTLSNVVNYSNNSAEPYASQVNTLAVAGDYLFVTTRTSTPSLIAYKFDESGMHWIGYVQNGSIDANGATIEISRDVKELTVSSDGQSVYAATSNGIVQYYLNTNDGSFTAGGAAEVNNIVDIAISPNGGVVYVTTSEGALLRYATADGRLTLIESTSISDNTAHVQVTRDGHVLAGQTDFAYFGVTPYQPDMAIGATVTMMPTVEVTDPDSALSDSYAGFTFTLTSSDANLSADNLSLDSSSGFSASDGTITFNGETVATYAFTNGQWALTITGNVSQSQLNTLLHAVQYTVSADSTSGEKLTFTLTTADNEGAENSNSWTMTVVEAIEPPLVNFEQASISSEQGQAFQYQFAQDSVTDPQDLALTWQIAGLPDGVSFDATTHTLSGTPTQVGNYSITVTVTNSGGMSTTFSFVLAVSAASEPSTPTDPSTPSDPNSPEQPDGNNSASNERFTHIHDFSAQEPFASEPMMGAGMNGVNSAPQAQSLIANGDAPQVNSVSVSELFNAALNTVSASTVSTTELWWQELQQNDGSANSELSASEEDGSRVQRDLFELPALSGLKVVNVTGENGQPLPDGISYNAQTGVLTVDSEAANRLSNPTITVTTQDANGQVKELTLPIQSVPVDSQSVQASMQHTVSEQMTLGQQTQQVSQQAMAVENQRLLAELS